MLTIGELCAGYGGISQGVKMVMDAEIAWVSEIAPGASMVLAHRFPHIANVGDLRTAPWEAIKPVDILTCGIPCQSSSQAGQRKGMEDERWLWPDIETAIGRMDPRPRMCVFECVSGLLTIDDGLAFSSVIHGLATLGYVGSYRLVRAADAGACHRRERWFCVAAHADGAPGDERRFAAAVEEARWRAHADAGRRDRASAADPVSWDLERRREPGLMGSTPPEEPAEGDQRERAGHPAVRRGRHAADAAVFGLERLRADAGQGPEHAREDAPEGDGGYGSPGGGYFWGPFTPAVTRWENVLGRAAPRPVEPGRSGNRLSPRFVEWMMGLPEGWVTAVPGLSRREQLTALGNGVVPQQCALALQLLLTREGAMV